MASAREHGGNSAFSGVAWLIFLSFPLSTAIAISSTSGKNGTAVQTVEAKPFITSAISKFGLGIEGAAVDTNGTMFAVAYGGGTTSGIGEMATSAGLVDQEFFFRDQTGEMSFNGLRFLPMSDELSQHFSSRAVVTDVNAHRLIQLLKGRRDGRVKSYEFCGDNAMKQPNDAAVATQSGRIYLSGGNYGKLTTVVGDGELWLCAASSSFWNSSTGDLGTVKAQWLGLFGLTNGIEMSPDENTLYMSETFNKDGEVVENRIWKFEIDAESGTLYNRTLLVDFREDGTEWIDVDGMRADVDGNLFVMRNGPAGIVAVDKLSPDGKLLLRIKAPGIKQATSCELGGSDGRSLFIVGKCVDDPDTGCVDVLRGNSSPGCAWAKLTSHHRSYRSKEH